AGIDQFLLRVEHVERGALADARLFAHAVERDLGRGDLRLRGDDLRLGRLQLAPRLHDARPYQVALHVELDAALAERLLGLADQRIFSAALIDRHLDPPQHRAGELVEAARRQIPALLHRAFQGYGRIE